MLKLKPLLWVYAANCCNVTLLLWVRTYCCVWMTVRDCYVSPLQSQQLSSYKDLKVSPDLSHFLESALMNPNISWVNQHLLSELPGRLRLLSRTPSLYPCVHICFQFDFPSLASLLFNAFSYMHNGYLLFFKEHNSLHAWVVCACFQSDRVL